MGNDSRFNADSPLTAVVGMIQRGVITGLGCLTGGSWKIIRNMLSLPTDYYNKKCIHSHLYPDCWYRFTWASLHLEMLLTLNSYLNSCSIHKPGGNLGLCRDSTLAADMSLWDRVLSFCTNILSRIDQILNPCSLSHVWLTYDRS